MSHKLLDGFIYHKRLAPKKHQFKYKFFMLDIDLEDISTLDEPKIFSYNSSNIFSFNSKDHFGEHEDFLRNVNFLLNHFNIEKNEKMRFITLPRIFGYVFNPISILILYKENKPTFLFAEVHNYNGGRVLYPVELSTKNNLLYKGESKKDMYVSPFFKRDGNYKFELSYNEKDLHFKISLYEDEKKVLISDLVLETQSFNNKNLKKLLFKHTFLTFWVVTRTIFQAIKLKLKGLAWSSALKKDQIRRI